MFLDILISTLLIVGATFAFIGSLGIIKLPDFYMRIHAPTKATTLGMGSLLIASVIFFTTHTQEFSIHEVLIIFFLFMTAPVSAHFMLKAALQNRIPDIGGEVHAAFSAMDDAKAERPEPAHRK